MLDLLFIMIIMSILGITIVISYTLQSKFNDSIQLQSDDIVPEVAKNMIAQQTSSFPTVFNSIFIFVYVGLMIVTWMSAFFMDTHPIFFVVMLFLMVILIWVSMGISNAMVDVMEEASLTEYTAKFGSILHFYTKMPFYLLITGIGTIIALMVRPSDNQ